MSSVKFVSPCLNRTEMIASYFARPMCSSSPQSNNTTTDNFLLTILDALTFMLMISSTCSAILLLRVRLPHSARMCVFQPQSRFLTSTIFLSCCSSMYSVSSENPIYTTIATAFILISVVSRLFCEGNLKNSFQLRIEIIIEMGKLILVTHTTNKYIPSIIPIVIALVCAVQLQICIVRLFWPTAELHRLMFGGDVGAPQFVGSISITVDSVVVKRIAGYRECCPKSKTRTCFRT
eukprot:PhF_6_TR8293/c0_g3_i2/m.12758